MRQHRRKKYPWGAVRWNGLHSRNHPTAKFAKRRLFYKFQLFNRSTCSTERQGNKRSAAADLIASIAFGRTRRTCARLPSYPPYKSKIPKGGFGALWRVFLLYLSSREERWSRRRHQRLDAVSKSVKTQQLKTIAPGGRKLSTAVS